MPVVLPVQFPRFVRAAGVVLLHSLCTTTAVRAQRPVPVDSATTTLTAAQRATTLAQVVAEFRGPTRDAYTSTTEHAERLRALVTPRRFYVAAFRNGRLHDDCTSELTYDADSAAFMLKVRADMHFVATANSLDALPVVCTERAAGGYVGRNGFGVIRGIRRVVGERYDVAIDAWLPKWHSRGSWQSLAFPVPPDQARQLRGRLVPMVLFAPTVSKDGFIVHRESGGYNPTLSSPVDITTANYTIAADQLELLLVDRTTGAIVARSGTMIEDMPPNLFGR